MPVQERVPAWMMPAVLHARPCPVGLPLIPTPCPVIAPYESDPGLCAVPTEGRARPAKAACLPAGKAEACWVLMCTWAVLVQECGFKCPVAQLPHCPSLHAGPTRRAATRSDLPDQL